MKLQFLQNRSNQNKKYKLLMKYNFPIYLSEGVTKKDEKLFYL